MSEVKKAVPFVYWANCDDPDYSAVCWHREDALTEINDHGGTLYELSHTSELDRLTAERDAALETVALKQRDLIEAQTAVTGWARKFDALQALLTAADERADVLESALRELLAGTGNSPGANRKYGRARAVLAGSPKQSTPEPCQGIPGTSFQRLNALANQGE